MKYKAILFSAPCKGKNNFWTCSITSPVGSVMPPCDLLSIAAVLRLDDIEPYILDLRLFKRPFETFIKKLEEIKPDAIITNITTVAATDIYPFLKIASNLVDKRIVFGFHAMALPEDVFNNGATHILAGDPEYSASAAVKGINMERGLWTNDLRSTPGWLDSLSEIPFQALDLINVGDYHSLIMGKGAFSILLANRGCPQNCTYCVIPFMFGHKPRFMSVERVVSEIEMHNRKYNIRSFFFIDSAINMNLGWLTEFCNAIIKRNLKIRWCSNMRVSPITEEILLLMKESGCFRLFFGVEDLDIIIKLNRNTTPDKSKKAFELTKKVGIDAVAFIILFPENDRNEREMTRRIMKMINWFKPNAIQCNLAIPYPGSKIYEDYMNKFNMPKDWSLFDPAGNKLPYPVTVNLIKVRQMVYLKFFLKNPHYVWLTLKHTDWRSVCCFIFNSLKVLMGR